MQIFEDYCYASVKGQKNQAFTWFVFFDTDTEKKYIEMIAKLSQAFTNFVPVYSDSMESFLPTLKSEIAARTSSHYIITSRLDNDDCLHEDYVDTVQKQFDSHDFMAINLVHGVTLNISGDIKCGHRVHANNPFISLIEKNDNIDTVCSRRHGQWGKIKLVKDINNQVPLWLSLIHGDNILNSYKGFGKVEESTLSSFNIASPTLDKLHEEMTDNAMLSSLKNRCADYTHYYLKKSRKDIRSALSLIPEK